MDQYFPLIVIALLAVMLFVLPARQRKRMATQQQQMQDSLRPGTPVMTTSGMHATVVSLGEKSVDLEISPGVVATFARQAVMQVRTAEVAPDATDEDGSGSTGARPADGTL